MSELGHSRQFGDVRVTSALALIADLRRRARRIRTHQQVRLRSGLKRKRPPTEGRRANARAWHRAVRFADQFGLTRLRALRNLLNRINLMLAVQPHFQKYFRSRLTQIKSISLAVSSLRGAYRDRHGTRGGMRWTRQ